MCSLYCFPSPFTTPPSPLSSGTHGYMAPEVIKKGVQYDSSADWFSFGCVLYKLLRGLAYTAPTALSKLLPPINKETD